MSTTIENMLVTQLIEYFNENAAAMELALVVRNNEHEETGEALWLQPNTGERKSTQYVGGSYKGHFPFTLCYQNTNTSNQDGRRAILDLPFYKIAEYFEGLNDRITLGDTTAKIEMLTHPAISYVSEDGQTIEHQATFRMEYRTKRPITIQLPTNGGEE